MDGYNKTLKPLHRADNKCVNLEEYQLKQKDFQN